MLFVLQIIRVLPAMFFNGTYIDIMFPNGRTPLLLEANETAEFRSPDFHTTLTFLYRRRKVSYPLVKLMMRRGVHFSPFPLKVDFVVSRIVEEGDKHLLPIGHVGTVNSDRKEKFEPPNIEENIPPLRLSGESGARWKQTGAIATADGEIVTYHDIKIGNSPIWNMTYNEFKSKAENPITFENLLEKLEPETNILIDLKYPSEEEIEMEHLRKAPNLYDFLNKFLDIVRDKQPKRELLICSFEPEAVSYVKKSMSALNVCFLTEGIRGKYKDQRRNSFKHGVEFCLDHDLQAIATDANVMNCDLPKKVESVHAVGLDLILYHRNVPDTAEFGKEISDFDCAGVDGLITDDVDQVESIINATDVCVYNNMKRCRYE